MNNYNKKMLMQESQIAMENAYSPYSNFKVGAAILGKSGTIYRACNFENASFGAGVCAERVALGKAISEGEREFIAIAVCGGDEPTTPCGICRQSLLEFGDIDVICCDKTLKKIETHKLSELLPHFFSKFSPNK